MDNEKVIVEGKFNVNTLFLILGGLGGIFVFLFFQLRNIAEKLDQSIFERLSVPCLFFGIFLMIYALVFIFGSTTYCLTVTNKRVYGKAMFGKRVDLPMDSISAVGSHLFKGITITSNSGRISFLCLTNRDDVHCAVSDLLVNRNTTPPVVYHEKEKVDADELRKYKKLLDDGVITQEEFDAKKKQLLGL